MKRSMKDSEMLMSGTKKTLKHLSKMSQKGC